jgi:putative methionine-R-sulfoxide reductase with GAF domain
MSEDQTVIEPLLEYIDDTLRDEGPTESAILSVLSRTLEAFRCVVGTVHLLDPANGMLHMKAQRGIPEVILDRIETIPIGRGTAGIAAERREPVQVCDLLTHEFGAAESGAREAKMEGSVSFPLLDGDTLCGVMGLSKPVYYEFGPDETENLMRVGNAIARYVRP